MTRNPCGRAVVLAISVLLLLGVADAGAHPAPGPESRPWHEGYTLVLTSPQDAAALRAARQEIERAGGRIAVQVPPRVMFGWVPEKAARTLPGRAGIELVSGEPVRAAMLEGLDRETRALVEFFNRIKTGEVPRAEVEARRTVGEPLTGDARVAPAHGPEAVESHNSEWMTGTVGLALMFVESNGELDEDEATWTTEHQEDILQRAIAGLSWWSARASEYDRWVTFVVRPYFTTDGRVHQAYEPIRHSSRDEALWIYGIMAQFGYTGSNHVASVHSFNSWLRGNMGTDWAYTAFVAYNPEGFPDRFTDGYFAYAYLGGPYTQLLYRNDGWGVANFDSVLAHETGHIFWACDEYYAPGYASCTSCGACAPGGPRPTAPNANCEYCNPNAVQCIMRGGAIGPLCPHTVVQVGWPVPPPADPANLQVTDVDRFDVHLQWEDRSDNEDGFRVERRDGDGPWRPVSPPLRAGTRSYVDTVDPPADGETYSYRVRAYSNHFGESGPSNEVQVTLYGARPPMPVPLRPTGCVDDTTPEFAWLPTPRAQRYRLRAIRLSDQQQVVNEDQLTTTSFTPTSSLSSGHHWWTVRACNNLGCGDPTAQVAFRVSCPPTLSVDDAAEAEGPWGAGAATVTVSLSGPSFEDVTVGFVTADDTARAGSDYTPVRDVVTFAAGQTTRSVVVPLLNDGAVEGIESLRLILHDPVGAVIGDGEASVTIVDDDAAGTSTVGLYRPSDGTFHLRHVNTTGAGQVVARYGSAGDVPLTGDWDGDGIDTIGVYRPSIATFFLRNSNTTGVADVKATYGRGNDIPLVGDWDGDGDDTIGVYRPSNQTFYLRNSNTTDIADESAPFGLPGDLPVVGDWNADGIDNIGVYRPSTGTFHLRYYNDSGPPDLSFQYGSPGDRPLAGDWDGDGVDTIGVWRPSLAAFYLRNSNTTGIADFPPIRMGNPQDKPIVGNWLLP
jgi:Calx-beta domain